MPSILEVQELRVAYCSRDGAAFQAIAGVNFDVRPGEILGVLGESGSGKSTLAASLLRLLPANGKIISGRIVVEGHDFLRANSKDVQQVRGARISLLFQEPSQALHPTMRIRDQVAEILRAHEPLGQRACQERARQVLAKLFPSDAERIASSYPHQLSGGQRQRVLIAQAIACSPAVLVADEPTASLDPSTQKEILTLFQTLRQELGLAIVLITHNPALLIGLADRVLVLYAGRIAEFGSANAVLFSPKHPYTEALLKCMPRTEDLDAPTHEDLATIPGAAPNL